MAEITYRFHGFTVRIVEGPFHVSVIITRRGQGSLVIPAADAPTARLLAQRAVRRIKREEARAKERVNV